MKQTTLIIAVFFAAVCYGQNDQSVTLRWKLQPNEVLAYKTVMQEVDTSKVKNFSINLGGIFELLNKDSLNKSLSEANNFFQSLRKVVEDMPLITRLSMKNEKVIDIEMSLDNKPSSKKNKTDSTANEMVDMIQKMSGGVMLRGAVYADGGLESFYVKNDQRNLIALFFQLPNKPIKVGETWSIDVNFISMDQNFKCDTSFKQNKVTLVDVKNVGSEKVAVLKYDLAEFVSGNFGNPMLTTSKESKTMMAMKYQAIGEFSLDQGRWTAYQGITTITSTGFMSQTSTKNFSLLKQ